MTERGAVPHFVTTTTTGTIVRYADLWQRRALVLAVLPPPGEAPEVAARLARLAGRTRDIEALNTACVTTSQPIPGLPQPSVLVADRWGEVYDARSGDCAAAYPEPDEILEWLQFIAVECPECQGEAR